MTKNRFINKTVVITGASSGIGQAAARQFAGEGARVVLAARSKERLEAVARNIGGEERALAVPADVADLEQASALLEKAEKHFGAIHILVNNAGCNFRGAVETKQPSELIRIVDLNLRTPIALCRFVLPYMRRAGHGAIINVASLAGRIPLADEATYSATKFGLRAFTFALAEELKGTGITVSAVSPGPVDTGFIMSEIDEVPDIVFSQHISSAQDIAALILDCADDGRPERAVPKLGAYLATAGYLFPWLRQVLKPLMERKGRAKKAIYQGKG